MESRSRLQVAITNLTANWDKKGFFSVVTLICFMGFFKCRHEVPVMDQAEPGTEDQADGDGLPVSSGVEATPFLKIAASMGGVLPSEA